MSKRTVAALIAICTMLSFSGCDKLFKIYDTTSTSSEETSEQTSSYEFDIPEDTTGASDTSSDETTDPSDSSSLVTEGTSLVTTPKPLRKVTISDAYKKKYGENEYGFKASVRIPKISIAGISTKKLNKEILNYCKKKSGKYCSCKYSYYVANTYISLLITFSEEHDMSPCDFYRVYNISRTNGKKLSKKTMLKKLGISQKKFNSRVKKAITRMFKKSYGYSSKAESYIKQTYKDAIKTKMIKKAIPFVGANGKTNCYIKDLPSPGGAGQYDFYGEC